MLKIFRDPLNREVRLSDQVWLQHIVKGHPEMRNHETRVADAIERPEEIQFSASDPECRVYYGREFGRGLRAVAVVDVARGTVKTAYLARKKRTGVVEWSR